MLLFHYCFSNYVVEFRVYTLKYTHLHKGKVKMSLDPEAKISCSNFFIGMQATKILKVATRPF